MKRVLIIILGSMFVTGVGFAQTTPNNLNLNKGQAAPAKVGLAQTRSGARLGKAFGNQYRPKSVGHGSLADGSIGVVDSSETVETSVLSEELPETEIERLERISGIPSRP